MKHPESMRRPTQKEIFEGRKDLLERIKKVSLFIGSRAWQVETEESDWDYLIQQTKLNKILLDVEEDHPHCFLWKELYEQSHGDSCDRDRLHEFFSIIIKVDEQVYNIISPINKLNYRAWRSAASLFDNLVGSDIIKNKYNRVEIFELFKKLYRNKYSKSLEVLPIPVKRKKEFTIDEDDIPF